MKAGRKSGCRFIKEGRKLRYKYIIKPQDPEEIGELLKTPAFRILYVSSSGGSIWIYGTEENYKKYRTGLNNNGKERTGMEEYQILLDIALLKANMGFKVEILPILEQNDPYRYTVYRWAKENKCPDLRIGNTFYEVKCPELDIHENKLINSINRASKQADHVIINLPVNDEHPDYPKGELRRIAMGRFDQIASLELIEFKIGTRFITFYRPKKK